MRIKGEREAKNGVSIHLMTRKTHCTKEMIGYVK